MPAAIDIILKYGPHAKRIVPRLQAYMVAYIKPGIPLEKDSPGDLIRKAINKINAMQTGADVPLKSIAEQIKNVQDPFDPNAGSKTPGNEN